MNEILEAVAAAQDAAEDIRQAQVVLEDKLQFVMRELMRMKVEVEEEVTELCPDCGREVCLKWSIKSSADYTISCPYCGYRMKLCSMCDARDGAACDWDSKTKNASTTGR